MHMASAVDGLLDEYSASDVMEGVRLAVVRSFPLGTCFWHKVIEQGGRVLGEPLGCDCEPEEFNGRFRPWFYDLCENAGLGSEDVVERALDILIAAAR